MLHAFQIVTVVLVGIGMALALAHALEFSGRYAGRILGLHTSVNQFWLRDEQLRRRERTISNPG